MRPPRNGPAGRHHSPHSGLQPGPPTLRAHALRRNRPCRPAPPQASFRRCAQRRRWRQPQIIATCLVDTGSRMDEVIFEEFKGTGNWELWLDRRLAEKRVFPAIDIARSGTRRDDLLLDEKTYQRVVLLRRMTALVGQNSQNSTEPTELILERLGRTKSNAEFLATLKDAV